MSMRWLKGLALGLAVAGCSESEDEPGSRSSPSPSESSIATQRIVVRVGHCFVEPVSFDGQVRNVRYAKQFGWGGGISASWTGSGVIKRLGPSRAMYTDDGGKELQLLPTVHPDVRAVETAGCD